MGLRTRHQQHTLVLVLIHNRSLAQTSSVVRAESTARLHVQVPTSASSTVTFLREGLYAMTSTAGRAPAARRTMRDGTYDDEGEIDCQHGARAKKRGREDTHESPVAELSGCSRGGGIVVGSIVGGGCSVCGSGNSGGSGCDRVGRSNAGCGGGSGSSGVGDAGRCRDRGRAHVSRAGGRGGRGAGRALRALALLSLALALAFTLALALVVLVLLASGSLGGGARGSSRGRVGRNSSRRHVGCNSSHGRVGGGDSRGHISIRVVDGAGGDPARGGCRRGGGSGRAGRSRGLRALLALLALALLSLLALLPLMLLALRRGAARGLGRGRDAGLRLHGGRRLLRAGAGDLSGRRGAALLDDDAVAEVACGFEGDEALVLGLAACALRALGQGDDELL